MSRMNKLVYLAVNQNTNRYDPYEQNEPSHLSVTSSCMLLLLYICTFRVDGLPLFLMAEEAERKISYVFN